MYAGRLLRWGGGAAVSVYAVDWYLSNGISRNMRGAFAAGVITVQFKTLDTTDREKVEAVNRKAAETLLRVCRTNGGLYIKLGQAIAAMNHILPPVWEEVLSELHDQAPKISMEEVEAVFRRDFGASPSEVFATFDEEPVAAASIAQVHRATLKADAGGEAGRQVAVKILKPSVQRQHPWDLMMYKCLVWMFDAAFLLPMYWTVEYTSRHLREELDFHAEAMNAERTAAAFAHRSDVHVPSVVWPLTKGGVLTTEWIDGVKITDVKGLHAMGVDPEAPVRTMLEVIASQMFCQGHVHCDPHPGNLLVRPRTDNRQWWRRRSSHHQVVILDHGLYVKESDTFRQQYCKFWVSIFLGDTAELRRICEGWGVRNSELFASFASLRPYVSGRPAAAAKLSRDDVKRFMEADVTKEKVQTMLQDTQLLPKELLLVGRSMNIVRANNKSLGGLVDRVTVFAQTAAQGLGHHSSLRFRLRLRAVSLAFRLAQWKGTVWSWFGWAPGGALEEAWAAQGDRVANQLPTLE